MDLRGAREVRRMLSGGGRRAEQERVRGEERERDGRRRGRRVEGCELGRVLCCVAGRFVWCCTHCGLTVDVTSEEQKRRRGRAFPSSSSPLPPPSSLLPHAHPSRSSPQASGYHVQLRHRWLPNDVSTARCSNTTHPLTLSLPSASVLDSVLYRVGLLASLRSKKLGGDVIGVMVTASHNPEHVGSPC